MTLKSYPVEVAERMGGKSFQKYNRVLALKGVRTFLWNWVRIKDVTELMALTV